MRVLLAEDDEKLNASLTFQLESQGFNVDTCFDGEDALFYAEQNIHDVILLDRMLPCMEGTDILKSIRRKNVTIPVILITAMGTLSDKVAGLDMGADDYLVKPFAFEELLARIRCVTRRPHVMIPDHELSFCDITYFSEKNSLAGPAGRCSLSKREGDLLMVLLKSQFQTVARTTLLLKVWGPDSDVENGNLDNYIHFLRRRLAAVGSTLKIKAVRGIGYCFNL